MTRGSLSERERLLQRIVTGELAPDSPEVHAVRMTDAAFAREVDELRELAAAIEEIGAGVRADLERASGPAADDADDARTRAFVRERLGPRASTPWLRRSALAAIAGVIALLFLYRPLYRPDPASEPDPGTEVLLGERRLELFEPLGTVEAFTVFRWRAPRAPGSYNVVRVLDPRTGDELARSDATSATSWEPGSDATARWPEDIAWEVEWNDGSGRVATSPRVSASRARH